MRLRSLAFAGYRSFAARSPAAPARPLERLPLAPVTVLLGKNNSGKSTAARLLHHVLLALAHDGIDPFPMAGAGRTYGASFRDVLHNGALGAFFNPLDLEIDCSIEGGSSARLAVQLIQPSDSADLPVVWSFRFGDKMMTVEGLPARVEGLLPDVPDAVPFRDGARRLLEASCYLGPVRGRVRPTYEISRSSPKQFLPSSSNDDVAQLLFADVALRTAVGDWMSANLDQWRVDVRQSLDVFNLVARRPGRESNLAVSGEGIQQVLPFVTLCCWRRLGLGGRPFLDVVEQPELHLHDAAHAPLGDLLLAAVAGGDGNVVVETHSESLVLRLRRRVAEGLPPEQVALLYVEDTGEGSRIRPIPLGPDGEVEWWPEGVFSESFVELKAIRRAQRARGGH
jgi:hypothetical protein